MMKNFELKTVDEWLSSVNGRRDWCVKFERKPMHESSIEFIDSNSKKDSFDKNRENFLRTLDEIMN